MENLIKFPSLGRETLRDFKKGIDRSFRDFSRSHGEGIENFFELLLLRLVGQVVGHEKEGHLLKLLMAL